MSRLRAACLFLVWIPFSSLLRPGKHPGVMAAHLRRRQSRTVEWVVPMREGTQLSLPPFSPRSLTRASTHAWSRLLLGRSVTRRPAPRGRPRPSSRGPLREPCRLDRQRPQVRGRESSLGHGAPNPGLSCTESDTRGPSWFDEFAAKDGSSDRWRSPSGGRSRGLESLRVR
jgi:hypothetical protein